jgi:hypothetical protein
MSREPTNLLIPFRRDRKRDFATGSGAELLASKVRQALPSHAAFARWNPSPSASLGDRLPVRRVHHRLTIAPPVTRANDDVSSPTPAANHAVRGVTYFSRLEFFLSTVEIERGALGHGRVDHGRRVPAAGKNKQADDANPRIDPIEHGLALVSHSWAMGTERSATGRGSAECCRRDPCRLSPQQSPPSFLTGTRRP